MQQVYLLNSKEATNTCSESREKHVSLRVGNVSESTFSIELRRQFMGKSIAAGGPFRFTGATMWISMPASFFCYFFFLFFQYTYMYV